MVKSSVFEDREVPLISLIARICGINEYPSHHIIDLSAVQQLKQGTSDNLARFPHLRVAHSKTAWLKRRKKCAKCRGAGSHTDRSTASTSRSALVVPAALLCYSHQRYSVKLAVVQPDSAWHCAGDLVGLLVAAHYVPAHSDARGVFLY